VVHTIAAMYKLITFVPENAKEELKEALFAAGAGGQGAYQHCAWECLGTGQFLPLAGADPAIGSVGVLERVSEWRIEMLVPASRWPDVKAALYQTHPYESPAFDLIALADSGADD
jgi:hypothetical protein